ncbi:MAG: protein kinase [Myxococcales bacterium]|nr:protein kinase [Myxococcales bacterium]
MDSSPTPATDRAPNTGWRVHKEVGADMIGELIAGRHRIIRRLARGGMADVFLAKDMTRRCHVAIKLLRSRPPEAHRRFKVEAEILSNLQHPNIVRAIEIGETFDGQPFMALEHIDGEPLSGRLARGPLPWREVARLGVQAADAVHAMHVAGIVHRDLKPDNIMVTAGERTAIKLIDLGLASVGASFHDAQDARFTPDPPARHQTQLGHPIGTPPYLPPEAGELPADPRLDVYSLAATLYQLCTQLLPQDAGGRTIRDACPGSDAPDDLSRLLQAALAHDPNERLPSADHLRRGLEAILSAHPESGPRHLYGGSYDLLEVLGVGASAVVYRASDRELSREVAVKVLRDGATIDDDVIRFRRAAKVLSALHHPSIPPILHSGAHAGQRFAVTGLCNGSPATNYVRPQSHLRPDEVLAVGLQLAGALAAVHAAGVVYRDLHPGNVLIARGDTPRAWIFDFDQAQVSPAFYAALTERWATPPEERQEPRQEKRLQGMDYASPEVRGGAAFTTASDVYALGLLLYRLLTGLRPFPAAGGDAVPARKVCPACPAGLEGLLLSMLSPTANRRPTLAAVLRALEDEEAELAAEVAPRREDASERDPDARPAPVIDEREPVANTAASPAADDAVQATALDKPEAAYVADVVPPADTIAAEPPAAFVSATDGAVATTTADAGAALSGRRDTTPPAPRRRLATALALGLTAVVSLAIGRATVPHAANVTDAPPSTQATNEADKHVPAPLIDERTAPIPGSAPPPSAPPPVPPPVPDTSSPPAGTPKREAGPRARREPVSLSEATVAAERALPLLRACSDVPRRVTADLDLARGHATVTALNLHAPAPDDPRYGWHACVQRVLEDVRFPASDTAGHVQVRLTVR